MRKLRKAAVAVAALGTVGLLGAGTAHAHGGKEGETTWNVKAGSSCRAHDLNVDALGEVGVVGGAQLTTLGSSMGCNNIIGLGK
ncbi:MULTISPECIES: hypothetical protein [unclassified Streptomyces]|uniref:hypothetical protein n=1 Tax=unclassified Streptomyces TaxID=2593676 RepID=UPI003826BB54